MVIVSYRLAFPADANAPAIALGAPSRDLNKAGGGVGVEDGASSQRGRDLVRLRTLIG